MEGRMPGQRVRPVPRAREETGTGNDVRRLVSGPVTSTLDPRSRTAVPDHHRPGGTALRRPLRIFQDDKVEISKIICEDEREPAMNARNRLVLRVLQRLTNEDPDEVPT
jgi:hypothetical protein